MKIFKIEDFIHRSLGISDSRDEELEKLTRKIGTKVNNESQFILELEKESSLSLREKLYVATQFGRLYRTEKE